MIQTIITCYKLSRSPGLEVFQLVIRFPSSPKIYTVVPTQLDRHYNINNNIFICTVQIEVYNEKNHKDKYSVQ